MDTVLPVLSDFHSGSPVALFPLKQMELSTGNVSPTKLQRIIHGQYDEVLERVAKLRTAKERLITVLNGDMPEGIHHGNKQIASLLWNDHKRINLELLDYGLRKMGHGKTKHDKIFMTKGTDSHTGEAEEDIAKDLGAVPFSETQYCHPSLKININGVRFWFAHQGANPGKDGTQTKGNGLRAKLKQIRDDCLDRGEPAPSYVVFSHFHHKWHEAIDTRNGTMHGFVLPSFQFKTDWALRYFPFEVENIGGLIFKVSAGGGVEWEWSTMEYQSAQEIRL